jgi:tetratricopeptide (TPR) repeat protein
VNRDGTLDPVADTTVDPVAAGDWNAVVDPDLLADLEDEREFLLRSLDDLDDEYDAGNLDDDEYERLRDDYTARAAAVIRAIRTGLVVRPEAPPRSSRRNVVAIVATVVVIVGAAVLLGRSLGERTNGGTVTGNGQIDVDESTTVPAAQELAAWQAQLDEYARGVAESPDDVQAHLEYARFLMTPVPGASGDLSPLVEAVREFGRVVELDPTNVEAHAYGGWALNLSSPGIPDETQRQQVVDAALQLIDEAIRLDPDYPDAQFFRGFTMIQRNSDFAGAQPYLERYLELVPEGEFSDDVRQVLATAEANAGNATSATTAVTTTPSTAAPTVTSAPPATFAGDTTTTNIP